MMEYSIESNDTTVFLMLDGCLDTNSVGIFAEKLDTLIGMIADKALEIDCHKLEFISSSGLRLLLRLRKATPTTITLKGVGDSVMEILNITKLKGFFNICE